MRWPPPRTAASTSRSREPHPPRRYRLTLQAEPQLMRCVSPQRERRPQLAIVRSGARADGIAWGTPTRYGNMSAQMKQFVDITGGLWLKGEFEDKATGIFTSTATIH